MSRAREADSFFDSLFPQQILNMFQGSAAANDERRKPAVRTGNLLDDSGYDDPVRQDQIDEEGGVMDVLGRV